MDKRDARVGLWVRTNVEFSSVPKGSYGLIVEDYETGFMVEWQRLYNQLRIPFRDGFDKDRDLRYLDAVPDSQLTWRPYVIPEQGPPEPIQINRVLDSKQSILDWLSVHIHTDFPGLMNKRVEVLQEPAEWHRERA